MTSLSNGGLLQQQQHLAACGGQGGHIGPEVRSPPHIVISGPNGDEEDDDKAADDARAQHDRDPASAGAVNTEKSPQSKVGLSVCGHTALHFGNELVSWESALAWPRRKSGQEGFACGVARCFLLGVHLVAHTSVLRGMKTDAPTADSQ